jgi:dTMP kinase
VAFAGLDGAGKTSQARLLGKWLEDQGFKVATSAAEGPAFVSKVLEDVSRYLGTDDLSEYITDDSACLLRGVGRYREWSHSLFPVLESADFGVTDRYVPCYYASVRARDAGAEPALRAIFHGLQKPAITIFLDVPPGEAYQRIQRRGADLEKIEFLTAYERAYRSLPEFEDFSVVDGVGSVEEVSQRIQLVITKHFPSVEGSTLAAHSAA